MSVMLQHHNAFASRVLADIPPDQNHSVYTTLVHSTEEQEAKQLEVRLATSTVTRGLAQSLVNKMYDWRGYGCRHAIPLSDQHSTFLAYLDCEAVGTITLAVDSDGGLAADQIFRDEINMFRRVPGASVCELTKLAFDTEMPSRKLMAALFHVVFIYGKRRHRCTDLFIEVNPRHRRFYESMLGFQPVGALKHNSSVGAPSQLMWLKVADIATRISEQAAGASRADRRSLYPLFLNRMDELHVQARLSDLPVNIAS